MFYNKDVMYMKKYVTNIKKNIYFDEQEIHTVDKADESIKVDFKKNYSFFSGMGGALTQASTVNYLKLNSYNKNKLISLYFKDLKYKYIRLPIGSCDFSPCSYDYYKPFGFNINKDKEYIIPLLDDIKEFNISYIASPWSPPKIWKYPIINRLRLLCYGRYAKYLMKYIKYYQDYGINIDFLSMQNEPYAYQRWESCLWSAWRQKLFIKKFLIPCLNDNNIHTSIMLHDHNKKNLLKKVKRVFFQDNKISSVGFHWYDGSYFDQLKEVHEKYPNLLLIESEMSCGFSPYDKIEWITDAEMYANEIIGNINSGMNIFIDWNLLLDENGGPNHKNNFVKSPIIRDDDEIIVTPIYYYLKHISLHQEQLVHQALNDKLKVFATTKDDKKIITVLNNTSEDISFNIRYGVKDLIEKHSIITYVI